MKTRIHKFQRSRRTATIGLPMLASALLLVAPLAKAELIAPTGAYMDAKAAPGSRGVPAQATGDMTGEVKQWVQNKIRDFTSYFSSDAAKPAAVAAIPRKVALSNTSAVAAPGSAGAPGDAAGAPASAKPNIASMPSTMQSPSSMDSRSVPPTVPLEKTLRAPAGNDAPATGGEPTGFVKQAPVVSYDIASSPSIPRLDVEKEEPIRSSQYAVDAAMQKILDERVIAARESPTEMSEKQVRALTALRTPRAGQIVDVKPVSSGQKGKINRETFDKLVLNLAPETRIKLKKYTPLSTEEFTFLSGLMLYQQGEQCPAALGLFHKLSKIKGWEAESNFYLAICSKRLGLNTDFHDRAKRVLDSKDVHYSQKVLAELGTEVPYEIAEDLGNALLRASTNPKIMEGLKPEVLANLAYLLADFSISTERYKSALLWAKHVPPTHRKFLKAQFLQALAEYQVGSKETAMKLQREIVDNTKLDKSELEFQALVALNAARMAFQDQNFKTAHENFLKVYKDHPLWLQSLTEMGWSQLMDGDFEGAIGNMYSIQSPFFSAVYKPESYVIRTIGYLNLCQYGDAYRALTVLEHDYRPYLEQMDKYVKRVGTKPAYYQTVRSFLGAPKKTTEVDGLPLQIVREIARHRDFINLQKALNRQIDERPNYGKIDNEVEGALRKSQNIVNNLRKYLDDIRGQMRQASAQHDSPKYASLQEEFDRGLNKLNNAFFQVDLYTAAKEGIDLYRKEVIGGADVRIASMKGRIETVLRNRLQRMRTDLARILDNNELLRYEVFAGSGENIRFQVAGGEVGKRVPASILPKSKSLQWDFDGEYWEDEIGHYRSGLKNNCPDKRAQASNEGGAK